MVSYNINGQSKTLNHLNENLGLQAKYKQINKQILFKKTNKQTTILVLKCNSYIIIRNIQDNKHSSSLCIIKNSKNNRLQL